jgi:hypothetical protein
MLYVGFLKSKSDDVLLLVNDGFSHLRIIGKTASVRVP